MTSSKKQRGTQSETSGKESNEVKIPSGGKTMTIQLLQNFYVHGKLQKKGSKHTFPKPEALKRMRNTNGVWTTPTQ